MIIGRKLHKKPISALSLPFLLLFSLNFIYFYNCVNFYKDKGPEKCATISASKHIVVAHCKENLGWLDLLSSFDPLVCQHYHIHIYSACGMRVDLNSIIPAVSECTTLHRSRDHGSEEYAYFRYIEDMYDNLPPFVSFIQGGGITENPHLIYDIMVQDLPKLSYKSLSRHVRAAWHMFGTNNLTAKNKMGESKISETYFQYLNNQSDWVSDWRSMFTVSDFQIKRNPLEAYAKIVDMLASGECISVNCNMEPLLSSFFGCNPLFFQDKPSCTMGVYTNVSNAVIEEDYMKDSIKTSPYPPAWDTEWAICGGRTILYSMSMLNGALICLDNVEVNSAEINHQMNGDVKWKPDFSEVTWHVPSFHGNNR